MARGTYPYDVVLGQLERATTQADVDLLVHDYAIYVRGLLEHSHPASEVTEERIAIHVGCDLGWLLGEISQETRARVIPMLPEHVSHPVIGRRVERFSDDELIAGGVLWAARAGRLT